MPVRNPFKREPPKVRPFVSQAIGHAQHETQGSHFEHREHKKNSFGDVVERKYRKGSSRENFAAKELIVPGISPNATIAERTLNGRMGWLSESTGSIESRMDVLSESLKTGKMWRMGQQPGFRGVSYGPDRSRHASVPIFGKIPGVNYIASLGQELFTGRFWFGSKSRMQKLNSSEINSIKYEIERLRGIRELYVNEFKLIRDQLRTNQKHPEEIENFAKENYTKIYNQVESYLKKTEKGTVINNIIDFNTARDAMEKEERKRKVA